MYICLTYYLSHIELERNAAISLYHYVIKTIQPFKTIQIIYPPDFFCSSRSRGLGLGLGPPTHVKISQKKRWQSHCTASFVSHHPRRTNFWICYYFGLFTGSVANTWGSRGPGPPTSVKTSQKRWPPHGAASFASHRRPPPPIGQISGSDTAGYPATEFKC